MSSVDERLLPPELRLQLSEFLSDAKRVAVLGVGSNWCADDGVGPLIITSLAKLLSDADSSLLLDGSIAPESMCGALRDYAPEALLVIDAAWLELEPGTWRLLAASELSGVVFNTHSLPLNLLLGYLHSELDCRVSVLAVQPLSTQFGREMCPAVQRSAAEMTEFLAGILEEKNTI